MVAKAALCEPPHSLEMVLTALHDWMRATALLGAVGMGC